LVGASDTGAVGASDACPGPAGFESSEARSCRATSSWLSTPLSRRSDPAIATAVLAAPTAITTAAPHIKTRDPFMAPTMPAGSLTRR
jgi:hypothetical protein